MSTRLSVVTLAVAALLSLTPAAVSETSLSLSLNVTPAPLSSAVRIEVSNGLGSGVAIAPDVIVTAAHVINGQNTVRVINTAGATVRAYVSKIDKKADIAVLRLLQPLALAPAGYSCIEPSIGDSIEAVGNPLGFRFVHAWGRIASASIENAGSWARALLADIVLIPGMSGGPVYGNGGTVVGIVVGYLSGRTLTPIGRIGSGPTFGVIVSTASVCPMLAGLSV